MTFDRGHIQVIREDLIVRVESTAKWREEKAAEYPDDCRNAQAAEPLSRLARNLWELPDDDPSWKRLVETWESLDDDTTFHVVETLSHVSSLKRYGFDAVDACDPVKFLERYISEIEDVATERAA